MIVIKQRGDELAMVQWSGEVACGLAGERAGGRAGERTKVRKVGRGVGGTARLRTDVQEAAERVAIQMT